MSRAIDILCVGEILIDCIGEQAETNLAETKSYQRFLGGSPTNVAINMARLGLKVQLVGTIGNDGLGSYALEKIKQSSIRTDAIKISESEPTTVIFVSKTMGTPDFVAYRNADRMITENQLPAAVLQEVRIFHTTAFALSKNPAQTTILRKAKEAYETGCVLSIDFNFSEQIWESRERAKQCLEAYCKCNPLVKISEDDMERYFGKRQSHEAIFKYFHEDLEVDVVCLTMGRAGVTLSQKRKKSISLIAEKIENIEDATGAGDAFWSGFLMGYCKQFSFERCLKMGQSLAAIKLQNIGGLPENMDVADKLLKPY